MSAASDQITEYLSVGGLFNPEMMNQTQHEAVRDTLIKARDDIQRLERYNAALREQVEELDAKWKMAEDQCFDQVGKIGELERENAALREQVVIRDAEIDMWASRCAAQGKDERAEPYSAIAQRHGFAPVPGGVRDRALRQFGQGRPA